MSKKLAEIERVNLEERCSMVLINMRHLEQTVLEIANAAVCFPEPWNISRSDSAGDIRTAARAVAKAVEDLLEAASGCRNMDKHENKLDGEVSAWSWS